MDTETQSILDYIKVNNDIKDELIPIGDDFKYFLYGITLNTENIDYIGFYEKNTKNVYFYLQGYNQSDFCSILHNAWQLFHKNDDINVKIYDTYYGVYDERRNDYETDRKYLYKYLIDMLLDKCSNK